MDAILRLLCYIPNWDMINYRHFLKSFLRCFAKALCKKCQLGITDKKEPVLKGVCIMDLKFENVVYRPQDLGKLILMEKL